MALVTFICFLLNLHGFSAMRTLHEAVEGSDPDTELEMAELAKASYDGKETVLEWRQLGLPVTRGTVLKSLKQISTASYRFESLLAGNDKKVSTLYEHKKKYKCTLAFSGTEPTNIVDIFHDLGPGRSQWCGIGGIHKGFADAMRAWWKSGGKKQTKRLITSDACKDSISVVGHSLGGAKAALLAACVNNNNGWLGHQLFPEKYREEITGDCHKVCHHDRHGGTCRWTHTNPLHGGKTYKDMGKVSHRGCCFAAMDACIRCCKVEHHHPPQWKEANLYTFAAPAVSAPRLTNMRRGDRCFQGARYFNYDDVNHHDEVTTIATALLLRHPKMEGVQLSESGGHSYRVVLNCKDDATEGAPSTWLGAAWKATLGSAAVVYRMVQTAKYHLMTTYIERIESAEEDECREVCHKDACSWTPTNPIPWGSATWKRTTSRTTEKGCCMFAADADRKSVV